MELHSMENASNFSGDSGAPMNNNDENKKPKESKDEEKDIMNKMIESVEKELKDTSPLRSCYAIYHVSKQLYKENPDAYRPLTVSIGPLHHNDDHLWITETYKLRYLNHLIKRFGKTFQDCVNSLSDLKQEEARKCYPETINLGKAEFAKMMVMDSCFILQFLNGPLPETNDHHFVWNSAWRRDILIDLIKLENQLPLFVLERLHGLLFVGHSSFSRYIYDSLIMRLAEEINGSLIHFSVQELETLIWTDGGAQHLLDLLRRILIASPREITSNERDLQLACNAMELMSASASAINGGTKHFLDLLRRILIPCPRDEIPPSNERDLQLARSVTELKSAGVKFQKKENASLLDIQFVKKKGELTIPTIDLADDTEVVLRNLIACEQQNLGTFPYITSYAALMDNLIDTTKDVTLLTQKGIIINRLGSPEDAATLFNKIVKHVATRDTHFSDVINNLNEYYNDSCHRRMANLRQTYFNSPWAGISVAAAAFVIFLTIIQTICSLLQFKK